jgi:ABC-type multidrug transport system permease subunit
MQYAFVIMLPSVLLSGFMFPRTEMPLPIYLVTFAIPVTYFIEILRGVILRGAELRDLIGPTIGLLVCSAVIMSVSFIEVTKAQKYLRQSAKGSCGFFSQVTIVPTRRG